MVIRVHYKNEHTEAWSDVWSPVEPIKQRSEADRLALTRSKKSRRIYRVWKNGKTLSQWKNGYEIEKEDWV